MGMNELRLVPSIMARYTTIINSRSGVVCVVSGAGQPQCDGIAHPKGMLSPTKNVWLLLSIHVAIYRSFKPHEADEIAQGTSFYVDCTHEAGSLEPLHLGFRHADTITLGL